MAIYHFSVKNISRSDGRSAVACSAYRSGEKLIDERQGKEQDYTKKTGVEFSKIYAPKNTNPELLDRNQLWNKVEQVENRKNSQLAREFEIAFPHELNKQERQDMLDDLCREIVNRHHVVVDAVIHAPHTKSGSDKRNYHAHIMLTTRSINEHGDLGQKTREFNDNGKQEIEFWREKFADLTNKHLMMAGRIFIEVDHRSYRDQKNGLEATVHEGSKITQLRRQGIATEISLKNDAIKARNAEKLAEIINGLEQEIIATEKTIAKLRTESPQIDKTTPNDRNVHQDQKDRLERKELEQPIKPLESQPQTKKATATDAHNAITEYKTTIEKVANQVFSEQQQKQIEDAKTWLAEIEKMRANTPMFFGKKDHLAKIEQEVAQYEKMRSIFAKSKETGVTAEHRAIAITIIESNMPIMAKNARNSEEFLKKQELEQAIKKINPNISMLAEPHNAYTGKILSTDSNGTVQQTKNGVVFHPNLKSTNVQAGKEYTITHTENQVKIQEHAEIYQKNGKSQDKGIQR